MLPDILTLSYPKSVHPYPCPDHLTWEPAFVQHESHRLKTNSLVATIPVLEKEWRVVFEVQVKRTRGAGNILHMTTGGDGSTAINFIPSVFKVHQGFKFAFHVNGGTQEKQIPKSASSFVKHWYEIQMIQVLEDSKYVFGIFIDKKEVLSIENEDPESFENVNVYTASPWYKFQRGSIRGLRIENRKPEEKAPETSMLDFYNNVMTFNESMVEATCCTLEGTSLSVSCGRGTSCSAVCYSKEATLCPSQDCKDCETIKEEGKKRRGFSISTLSSSAFSHCTRKGCPVGGRSKFCCFHPQCQQRRQRECSFMRYFLGEPHKSLNILLHCIAGNSCPRPGHIVHGEWTCQKQQVPIPDTADLGGNLETYPGSCL